MAFQTDISSADAFKREVLEVPGTCQIVEAYNQWAGPCKAIISTFKRIYFDAGDKPLKFFTVNVNQVPGCGFEECVGHSQPVFYFYKDGKVIDKVIGVVAPTLERKIAEYSA